MGIQNFLQAQKGDPDWTFTPDHYFDKKFKLLDASVLEMIPGKTDSIVLRQNPPEKGLLAKQLRIEVLENSNLDLTIINEADDDLQQIFIYDILVKDGGIFNFGLFVKGGKLNKHIIRVTLDNYATFSTYGHIINTVGGDCEIITKILHEGSCSNSHISYTTEAGADSQTVYQGVTHVGRHSHYSHATIEISNLVVGEDGKCHSVPEIFNHSDSTKISCGTSTDYVDHERIYYLRTRGISKKDAETLLVNTHRNRTMDIIVNEELKDEIIQLLD